MMQTWALLRDAYRELNHRKLFWVTMAISGIVVLAFAAMGNNEDGLTVLYWTIPIRVLSTDFFSHGEFYKFIFSELGIGFWLTWIATILAVISTASIFPDFVGSGSIDLMLSKPISRTRLFLTKFMTGLLFVALQVTVFTIASMLVIGIRGGEWEPWILISIPLVVIFYSYLFCVQAVVGMITRSAIASIIAVMLFWMLCFGLQAADGITLAAKVTFEVAVERDQRRLDAQQKMLEKDDQSVRRKRVETIQEELVDNQETLETLSSVNYWLHLSNSILPKTAETIDILTRTLDTNADMRGPNSEGSEEDMFGVMVNRQDFAERMESEIDESHSKTWVLGTSLLFEAVVLAFGALWFARKDF
jgi:hypothetical protein